MTAIAMKCEEVKEHPSANSLKVYKFSSKGEQVQIVANLDNEYEVGDVAIIVLEGSILKDGLTIERSFIRGIVSYGMALGKTSEKEGTDLTTEYCKEYEYNGEMIRWPKIGSLSDVNKWLKKNNSSRKINYKGKIKLDGTNASIILTKSKMVVQSRNRILTINDDNYGFANWVNDNKDVFKNCRSFANSYDVNDPIIIYGEWAGPGIQKRVAISKLDKKIFAIFAVQVGIVNAHYEVDPEKILDIIGSDIVNHDQIFVLPWEDSIELDFSDSKELEASSDILNRKILSIEKCDPWVKNTFGIEGLGEGLVMYPILNGRTFINKKDYSEFVFKAKGEAHQVVKVKKAVQIEPEVAESIDKFVDMFVTSNRLIQISNEIEFNKRNTGAFVKALIKDVKDESVNELKASGLKWDQVNKAISKVASNWWLTQCNKL